MATEDLCRDVAIEAVRRGAPGNVHELWALLHHLASTRPDVIVDIGSGPALWWAWWSLGPQVIGVTSAEQAAQPTFMGVGLPSSVVALVGDPADRSTVLRLTDQVARRPVDVLVVSARDETATRVLFHAYIPQVRPGGQVLVHGIANPATPGVGAFWRGLESDERQELIGELNPDGYGIVTVPRKVNSDG